jgi:hypothetical protein
MSSEKDVIRTLDQIGLFFFSLKKSSIISVRTHTRSSTCVLIVVPVCLIALSNCRVHSSVYTLFFVAVALSSFPR